MSTIRKCIVVVVLSAICHISKTPILDAILILLQACIVASMIHDVLISQNEVDREEIITYKGQRYKLIYKKGLGKTCPLIEPLDGKSVPNEVIDYVYFSIFRKLK